MEFLRSNFYIKAISMAMVDSIRINGAEKLMWNMEGKKWPNEGIDMLDFRFPYSLAKYRSQKLEGKSMEDRVIISWSFWLSSSAAEGEKMEFRRRNDKRQGGRFVEFWFLDSSAKGGRRISKGKKLEDQVINSWIF